MTPHRTRSKMAKNNRGLYLIINAFYTSSIRPRGLGSVMTRFITTLMLASVCVTAYAASPADKSQAPAVQTVTQSNAPALGNPFLPKPLGGSAMPSAAGPTAPLKKKVPLIDQERAFVRLAFLDYGTKVGTVDGKTIFKLQNHYLFVHTTPEVSVLNLPHSVMQEAQLPPPIPSQALGANARSTSSGAPRVVSAFSAPKNNKRPVRNR